MESTDIFVRHFLAIYFVLVGLNFASTTCALSERTGFTHIAYGKRYSPGWWHRHVFNLFRATILAVVLIRVVTNIDNWLVIISPLYTPWILLTGVVFMLASYVVTAYVHAYMHQDWRSGISPASGQHLVTTGPFSRTRNPLFIGIITGQFGFFLAMPSVFSLICLIVGFLVVINQAKMEEFALKSQFGDTYELYKQSVPRWL